MGGALRNKWHLTVNEKKRKVMIVNNDNSNMFEKLWYFNSNLDIVNSYEYLGIIISNDCKLSMAYDCLLTSATKAYYSLNNTLYIHVLQ